MIYLSAQNLALAAAWTEIDARLTEEIEAVFDGGFSPDEDALSLRGHAHDAAKLGQWGHALAILFAAAMREPSVFLPAYQSFGWAIATALGAVGGAANGPSPTVTDRHRSSVLVPPPWSVTPDRWASPFGQATVTAAGALRIELSTELGRNHAVTLPLVPGRCRRA